MNPKKLVLGVIVILVVAGAWGVGVEMGKGQAVCPVCQPTQLNFSLFWDAYNKLQAKYINPEKLDNQKILYGAISGMAKSLDDPYTSFFDPEQAKRFEQDLSGSFEGIGVEVGLKKGQLTVIAPLEGTPGEKAGLKPGDIIVKINDKSAADMTVEEAVSLIRGKKGTDVILNIFREGWQTGKDFRITRGTIVIPGMSWKMLDGNVAYIQINQFDQTLSTDFRKAAAEILQKGGAKIILDLRNNPGGYLDVSQDIAGWFLEKGKVVTIEDFGNKQDKKEYKSEGAASFANTPVVILINEGSASASEILAGALRDNRGIKLVGQKSFGKGSVQEVINLSDGSFIKVTIAKWLTPKGASISEVGLEPDVKIQITDQDIEQKKDPQLDKALEIIKSLPQGN